MHACSHDAGTMHARAPQACRHDAHMQTRCMRARWCREGGGVQQSPLDLTTVALVWAHGAAVAPMGTGGNHSPTHTSPPEAVAVGITENLQLHDDLAWTRTNSRGKEAENLRHRPAKKFCTRACHGIRPARAWERRVSGDERAEQRARPAQQRSVNRLAQKISGISREGKAARAMARACRPPAGQRTSLRRIQHAEKSCRGSRLLSAAGVDGGTRLRHLGRPHLGRLPRDG